MAGCDSAKAAKETMSAEMMEVEKEQVGRKVAESLHSLHRNLSLSDQESSFDFVDLLDRLACSSSE